MAMIGTVINSSEDLLNQHKTRVLLNKDSTDHCKGCPGCASLFKCQKNSSKIIIAKNNIDAKNEDRVNLELESGAVLKASGYLLFLPLVIFLSVSMFGTYLNLKPILIFLLSMGACSLFYCILKLAFRYKTYYVIVSKESRV